MKHKPFEVERVNHRAAKVAHRVREVLSTLIPGSLKDPRLYGITFITITDVSLSPDMRHAQVQFSLMNDSKKSSDVEGALNQAAGYLRKELMHDLESKTTPHLHFKFDPGFDRAHEMDEVFKKIETPKTPNATGDDESSDE